MAELSPKFDGGRGDCVVVVVVVVVVVGWAEAQPVPALRCALACAGLPVARDGPWLTVEAHR